MKQLLVTESPSFPDQDSPPPLQDAEATCSNSPTAEEQAMAAEPPEYE